MKIANVLNLYVMMAFGFPCLNLVRQKFLVAATTICRNSIKYQVW